MVRLGILSTHPIQYHSPLFKKLAQTTDLEVYYARKLNARTQGAGFNAQFQWDVPLLEGYRYQFLGGSPRNPLESAVRGGRFDFFIVFGWNYPASWQALRACKTHRVPVYARGDSQLPGRPRWLQIAKKPVFGRFLEFFDGFFAPGKRFSQYLEYYGVPDKKIIFCPHCVDNDFFRANVCRSSQEKDALRASLGLGPADTVFLFCGKFEPKKRIFDFLAALKQIQTEGVKAAGLLVGSGALHRPLADFSKTRGINAVFAGFVNQRAIPKYFSAADCLVLPSDGRETWGLVVNEAFACGIPAIVSDSVGCAADLIDEPKTGYIHRTGDAKHMAEKMRRFVEHRQAGGDFLRPIAKKASEYSIDEAARRIQEAGEALC